MSRPTSNAASRRGSPRAALAVAAGLTTLAAAASSCGSASSSAASVKPGTVPVVAGENQYGDVVSQIGGPYVSVLSVDSNPNTDPHTYEATPSVAKAVGGAKLLIENGLGYDDFMAKLASASPSSSRKVLKVQQVLGLPDSTPNPHVWYDPKAMPAVAKVMADDLSAIDPAHAATFQANEAKFTASLIPWTNAIAAFKAKYGGTPAATTEPVADYLLTAMGLNNLTPFGFQADIMNGTDPSPQDVATENRFFTAHQVKVFCYNQQVTDQLTASIRRTALKSGVPVVGVYETMPTPGYSYQSWMLAETNDIQAAVTSGTSAQHL